MLRQKLSSLFILLGWSSISVIFLMIHSMYLGLVVRMLVFMEPDVVSQVDAVLLPSLYQILFLHMQLILCALCFLLVSCLSYSLTLKLEAVFFSEALVDLYQTTVLHPRR
jgi:hypothetical protein